MRATYRNALMFSLAASLVPTSTPADEHQHDTTTAAPATQAQGATPASTQQPATAAGMQALRQRMQEMRRTRDPAKRMQLMEAQMAQMDEVMKNVEASCPMAGQGSGAGGMGGGMHGGGMGGGMMGGGMGGGGMGGGHGMGMMGGRGGMGMGGDEMMAKRLEMMEKRMDMMQMLLEQNVTRRQAPASRSR